MHGTFESFKLCAWFYLQQNSKYQQHLDPMMVGIVDDEEQGFDSANRRYNNISGMGHPSKRTFGDEEIDVMNREGGMERN